MSSVDRVKAICKERKIPISRLERDLEFANGYISQLRKGVLPDDRLAKIADYLSVSVDYLMNGEGTEKAPPLTEKEQRDIGRFVDGLMKDLTSGKDIMFDGVPVTDEQKASMTAAMMIAFEEVRRRNKETYTPKKYRKE